MAPKERRCKYCGNPIDGPPKKKFCDGVCRSRYFSYVTYQEKKDDPQFIAMRRRNFKNWYEKNREHFNDKMRDVSRRWQQKRRAKVLEEKHKQ